jgi:hypothetical protein
MNPGESLSWTFPGDWHWVSDWLVKVHAGWALVESASATGATAIAIAAAPAASSGAVKRLVSLMFAIPFRN